MSHPDDARMLAVDRLAEIACEIDLLKSRFSPITASALAIQVEQLHNLATFEGGDRIGEIYAPEDASA